MWTGRIHKKDVSWTTATLEAVFLLRAALRAQNSMSGLA